MTDFEVMQKMSKDNMDISMLPDIVEIKKNKQGGLITVGSPPEIIDKILRGTFLKSDKYYIAVYVINKEQFDSIKDNPDKIKN